MKPPSPDACEQALSILVASIKKENNDATLGSESQNLYGLSFDDLERMGDALRSAADALQRIAHLRAASFSKRRNALLPIHQLPSEILSYIFLNPLELDKTPRVKNLHRLAQVASSPLLERIHLTDISFVNYTSVFTHPLPSAVIALRNLNYLRLDHTSSDLPSILLHCIQAPKLSKLRVESYDEISLFQVLATPRWGSSPLQNILRQCGADQLHLSFNERECNLTGQTTSAWPLEISIRCKYDELIYDITSSHLFDFEGAPPLYVTFDLDTIPDDIETDFFNGTPSLNSITGFSPPPLHLLEYLSHPKVEADGTRWPCPSLTKLEFPLDEDADMPGLEVVEALVGLITARDQARRESEDGVGASSAAHCQSAQRPAAVRFFHNDGRMLDVNLGELVSVSSAD